MNAHIVLTYGTFDLFHIGHVRLLERARGLGDSLVVGLSTDEFNLLKGKKSSFSFQERFEILSSIKFVSRVIPEISWDQKEKDIKELGISTFVMGDDWKGKFDRLNSLCKVVYLPRTEGISTTFIKQTIATDGTK